MTNGPAPDSPVIVRWVDSLSDGGWKQVSDAKREAADVSLEARTVGFIIDDTDDYLLIAMGGMHDAKVVHDTMQIPKVAVLEVTRLAQNPVEGTP